MMLELPEALTLGRQLSEAVVGKRVLRVLPPARSHKFCWFEGDPANYDSRLRGRTLLSAEAFGIFAELVFDGGLRLCVNDGVNVRLIDAADAPKAYQLLIVFDDDAALVFTVAMYGGIVLHDDDYNNEYYLKSRGSISPLSPEFEGYYRDLLARSKPTLSMKALLATEQRFPGIGNGVLQDVLWGARLHPKRKLQTLDDADRDRLLDGIVSTLRDMTEGGGRDTEKDLYGNPGSYVTKMSKNTLTIGCPACGGPITREAYLGGNVYYCARCQEK